MYDLDVCHRITNPLELDQRTDADEPIRDSTALADRRDGGRSGGAAEGVAHLAHRRLDKAQEIWFRHGSQETYRAVDLRCLTARPLPVEPQTVGIALPHSPHRVADCLLCRIAPSSLDRREVVVQTAVRLIAKERDQHLVVRDTTLDENAKNSLTGTDVQTGQSPAMRRCLLFAHPDVASLPAQSDEPTRHTRTPRSAARANVHR